MSCSDRLQHCGHVTLRCFAYLGRCCVFLYQVVVRRPQPRKMAPLWLEQIHAAGVLSLLVIGMSALFIGMVVGLQGFSTLSKFGAEQQLGQLIALSVVRELGPVVTALLFAGRACSAIAAEIGLMKSTDQLAAMEMMGVDPLHRVVAPRFWGAVCCVPLLTMFFNMVAILGGYLVGVLWLGIDEGTFWSNMQSSVQWREDVVSGLIKSVVFGMVVAWVAVFEGYDCEPTASGVARATTSTVVYSSLAVLGLDYILTSLMIGGW